MVMSSKPAAKADVILRALQLSRKKFLVTEVTEKTQSLQSWGAERQG